MKTYFSKTLGRRVTIPEAEETVKIRKNISCPYCGAKDSTLNPIMKISNAEKYLPKYVCSECVSKYDGIFGWDGDVLIYV